MSTSTDQSITRRATVSRHGTVSRVIGGIAIAALAAGGLTACGDDVGVEATGAWARTSPAMVTAGAAYMTISSDEAVQIVAARVDPEVAGTVELHEVVPAEMEDGEHDGADMVMTMQEVTSIDIPAGGSVTFEPGGYHVMLLDLPDPLETGEEFDVTLVISDDTELVVPVVVREDAPE